jgi:hypothetical protein
MRLKDSTTGALRNRRKALRNPYNENAGECDINLGGFSIVAIVLFLFFLGYFVMESYLTTACANAPSSISSKSQLLRATEAPTAKVEASETPAAESPSPLSPSKEGFPQACTEDQLATLSKQLPADGCRKPAFEQACSFTKATTRGCRDSIWMREFFATTQLPTPFLSFIVGYDPSHASFSDVPLDSLFIGSHKNTNADQKAAWFAMAGVPAEADCKRPVTASSPSQEAKVVVITSKSETAALKNQVGISDAEMQVILGNGRLDDKTISENLPTEDAQFHYVHLPSINTMDHKFLATSQKISKAWYLEFTIDWRGTCVQFVFCGTCFKFLLF